MNPRCTFYLLTPYLTTPRDKYHDLDTLYHFGAHNIGVQRCLFFLRIFFKVSSIPSFSSHGMASIR